MVVFAKSGAGKSYAVKLEILRMLMLGTDVIIIDPENEYKHLCETVGGSFIKISLNSDNHINPFDLPHVGEDEDPEDVLRNNIAALLDFCTLCLDPSHQKKIPFWTEPCEKLMPCETSRLKLISTPLPRKPIRRCPIFIKFSVHGWRRKSGYSYGKIY